MIEGLERIGKLVEDFSDKVAQCRDKDASTMADIQDAYSRLYRVLERYKYEADTLYRSERAALRKALEDDKFTEGMINVRLIADHVEKGPAILRNTDNSPFTITATSSAAVVFSDRCVSFPDIKGVRHRWDHVKQLTEAERRITRAFENAKCSTER